ncbi:MAG: hypothetical protein V4605_04950 [Pseudomonadota bacterium]
MIVGIDPDISKSGVAWLHDDDLLDMNTANFVETLNFIRYNKSIIKCVYLEAGWLNQKSNWHGASNMSVASSIGRKVGENHATGKLLQQCIEAEQIKVVLVKPTQTKLDAKQFARLTGYVGSTNQEKRDAALLIFGRRA